MIKKFYYNPSTYEVTLYYGSALPYVHYEQTQSITYVEQMGDVIQDIQTDLSYYSASDFEEYGFSWNEKWYLDQACTTEVPVPYTVTQNVTFYTNIIDQVTYGIKVKAGDPINIGSDNIMCYNQLCPSPGVFGANTYIPHCDYYSGNETYNLSRSYFDSNGYLVFACVGTETEFNVGYHDASIDSVYIPGTITDLSNFTYNHQTQSATITFDGTSQQFLTAVGNNSISLEQNYPPIVNCSNNVTLTYDFTNNQWIQI